MYKVNIPVVAHASILAWMSTFFDKLKTYLCKKCIRIVEHKFIIHYLLKISDINFYCNIMKNEIFLHVGIIEHQKIVLIFHAVELFFNLSKNMIFSRYAEHFTSHRYAKIICVFIKQVSTCHI